MSILLPGYEQMPLAGVPGFAYDEYDDPKALLHSTEGTSIEGAVSAYRAYPPHLIVDPWKRRKVQHISLDRAAYALWNGDADDSRCIQVEIVGFAGQSHTWPDEVLRWLGVELARPLHEYAGVPYVVVWKGFRRDGEMPFKLADPSSPLRLTQAELDLFSGFLGHQHVPGDGHWDPGGLNVHKIIDYAKDDDVSWTDEITVSAPGDRNYTETHEARRLLGDGYFYASSAYQEARRVGAQIAGLSAAVTELAKLVGQQDGADAAEIEAAVAKAIRENVVRVDIDVAGTNEETS